MTGCFCLTNFLNENCVTGGSSNDGEVSRDKNLYRLPILNDRVGFLLSD